MGAGASSALGLANGEGKRPVDLAEDPSLIASLKIDGGDDDDDESIGGARKRGKA